ncbi:hypothetical protein DOY81_013883 [Sarcophaga bullata]|nr:hypothetical protein DOY81_013883 [Sarcophaga bullata]
MSTTQATKNCITLNGSAQIIAEYLKFGINSILFQRGIYPAETFDSTQQYGLTILMSKDPKIEEFLQKLGDGETNDPNKLTSSKELKRIQNEIRDVMRQISATVTYLPLLDCICTFDVMIHTLQTCDIPESWDETGPAFIQNAQAVQLRSFSTGLLKLIPLSIIKCVYKVKFLYQK